MKRRGHSQGKDSRPSRASTASRSDNDDWDPWNDAVSQLSEASSQDGHHSKASLGVAYPLRGAHSSSLAGRAGSGRQTTSQEAHRVLEEKQKGRELLQRQSAAQRAHELRLQERSPSPTRREMCKTKDLSPIPTEQSPTQIGTAALELVYFQYFNQRVTRKDIPEVLRYLAADEVVVQSSDFLDDLWASMVENVPSPYVDYFHFATVLQSYGLGGEQLLGTAEAHCGSEQDASEAPHSIGETAPQCEGGSVAQTLQESKQSGPRGSTRVSPAVVGLSRLMKPTASSTRKTREQPFVGPVPKHSPTKKGAASKPRRADLSNEDHRVVQRLHTTHLKQGVEAATEQVRSKELEECHFKPQARPLPEKHVYSDPYHSKDSINNPAYNKDRYMRCTDTWNNKLDTSVMDVSGGPQELQQEVITEDDLNHCTFAPEVNASYQEHSHPAPATGYLEAVTTLRKNATYSRSRGKNFVEKLRDSESGTPRKDISVGCSRHQERAGKGGDNLMSKPITRVPIYVQTSSQYHDDGQEAIGGEVLEEIPISPNRPDPTNIARAFCDKKGYALNDPNRIEIERTLRYVIEQSLIPRYNTKPSQRLYSHANTHKTSDLYKKKEMSHAQRRPSPSAPLRSASARSEPGRHSALRAPSPIGPPKPRRGGVPAPSSSSNKMVTFRK